MTPPLLYSADAAADQLGTTTRRIHELRRAGKLLAVLDGRQYKFRSQDLQDYVDSLPSWEPGR